MAFDEYALGDKIGRLTAALEAHTEQSLKFQKSVEDRLDTLEADMKRINTVFTGGKGVIIGAGAILLLAAKGVIGVLEWVLGAVNG